MPITLADLVAMLLAVRGAKFITFTARTALDLYKTDNPFPAVWKTATVNGMVNFYYDRGVLKRLEKEGKDESTFRRGTSWHEPVLTEGGKLTPICKHKREPRYYLRFMWIQTIGQAALSLDNGDAVSINAVLPFIKPGSQYANQGLDDPLVFLTYGLAGIQSMVIDGETWSVAD